MSGNLGNRLAALRNHLFETVDGASLAFLRMAFGLVMFCDLAYYLVGGRLERFYVTPVFHFKYFGWGWVAELPRGPLYGLFLGLALAALAMAVGYQYRFASRVFAVGYAYVFFLDAAAYNNHNYLILLLATLFALTPLERAGTAPMPRWVLWLFRFQIGMPYFYGGLAKINADWMFRFEPVAQWLREGPGGNLDLALFREPWMGPFFAWSGLLFDLAVVPALLYRRTRAWAYLAALAFHLINSQVFVIGVFPWLMILATTIFLPPEWPRRWGLARKPSATKGSSAPEPGALTAPRTVTVFLVAWLSFQLLFPFRHVLYPGWVDWTEEGIHYAWRMKIRDKRGLLEFEGRDPATGKVLQLAEADALLTAQQKRMILHDPELIRQFAHYLGDQLEVRTGKRLEIRARTSISLNGRPRQPMVDPEVDLSRVDSSWGAAPWILPLQGD